MQTARSENKVSSILLVIEPDVATRTGMKRLLEMNGYSVKAVADELEAAVVGNEKDYDLVVFDSNLPPPQSFAAAHQLHLLAELKNTPVLTISVHEKFDGPINDQDADKFTVVYMTDLSRFDELEKLIGCLSMRKM